MESRSHRTTLRTPVPSSPEWQRHYYEDVAAPLVIGDADWAARTSTSLLFTDAEGMADHMSVLRDAGVRNVVPWMGVGGVPQEYVLRSMQLFAEHVMPKFAD